MPVTISELWIYPIKSCRGISVETAEVQARGFAGDRRFMLVDPDGKFLTQRTLPVMARIDTRIDSDVLVLSTDELEDFAVPFEGLPGPEVETTVWKSTCAAIDQGDDAADWFSEALAQPCRLVFMPDETRRAVDKDYGRESDIVSFADGYPFLLTSEASLEDLNRRLVEPVSMTRFRPNIVIAGSSAYKEDEWASFEIGEVTFHVIKPCSRCVVITTDQESGDRTVEPLRTLATYRQRDGKVYFGQNLVHDGVGPLSLGDTCTAMTSKA